MINLKEWYEEKNIFAHTLKNFWHSFETYAEDDYEEFAVVFPKGNTNVSLKPDRISYEIDLPNFLQDLIAIYINIYVDERQVGWFKQLYLLDGEPFDEYFIID